MEVTAGIATLDIPALLAGARKRIILHAAIYGPFAKSKPHRDGLLTALGRSSFEQLDIIALADDQPWTSAFLEALRFESPIEERFQAVKASKDFLEELKTAYPDTVQIRSLSTFPCLPIIIVDDTIIFGQYAHSEILAADGFWGKMQADVAELFHWATTKTLPNDANELDKAAYRLVSECHHAITSGTQWEENDG